MEEILEIAKIIKIILSDQIDKSEWVKIEDRLDTIIERFESAKACRDRCLDAAAAACDKTEETVCEGGRPDEGGMGDREEEDRSSSA